MECKHFTPCTDKPAFECACLVKFGRCSCSKKKLKHFRKECPEYEEASNGWLGYEDERLALGESYVHIYRKRCMTCNGVFDDDEVHYIEKYEDYQCNKCWDRHQRHKEI